MNIYLAVAAVACLFAACVALPLFVYGIVRIVRKEVRKGLLSLAGGIVSGCLACGVLLATGMTYMVNHLNSLGSAKEVVEFKPAEFTGEMGLLTVDGLTNVTVEGYDCEDYKSMKFHGTDGKIQMPTGRYSLTNLTADAVDSAGKAWRMRISLYGKCDDVAILKNAPFALNVGSGLSASVIAFNRKGTDIFEIAVKDAAGNAVTISPKDDAKRTPPKFQIVDAGGAIVLEKSFEFG